MATMLNIILGYATGVKIGYLVFYFVVYYTSKKLCNLWDVHKSKKQNRKNEENFQKKIYCKECGRKIFLSDKFCDKCGARVAEHLLNNGKFCYKCGANITHDNNNCHLCFAKIELEEQ